MNSEKYNLYRNSSVATRNADFNSTVPLRK